MSTTGYRIEYWHYDEVVILAEGVEGEDPEAILAPYVCRLCARAPAAWSRWSPKRRARWSRDARSGRRSQHVRQETVRLGVQAPGS